MKNNRKLTTIIMVLVFLTGLCLLLYPKASDYWNSMRQSTAINHYLEHVAEIDEKEYKKILEAAREYNASLAERQNKYTLTQSQKALYPKLLNLSEDGIMGVVEIPVIGVSLPVYHGTSTGVLQRAVGHLEWTSLPIGGESTHCVLSGHRGLPSSKLLTDLDKLVDGDIFFLRVLNETLTYEVDQVLIVLPEDLTSLEIVEKKDYCTLVTCTPYGVNTHRILVRGHRIENPEEVLMASVTSDAVQIEPLLVAPILFIGVLLVLIIISAIVSKKKQ